MFDVVIRSNFYNGFLGCFKLIKGLYQIDFKHHLFQIRLYKSLNSSLGFFLFFNLSKDTYYVKPISFSTRVITIQCLDGLNNKFINNFKQLKSKMIY